jgi:hypothetical protein
VKLAHTATLLALGALLATAQEPPIVGGGVDVGEKAPLSGAAMDALDGPQVELQAQTEAGKIIVLEWFDPTNDASVRRHDADGRRAFAALRARTTDQVEYYLVATFGLQGGEGLAGQGRDEALAALREARFQLELPVPVLLDQGGGFAERLGVRHAPHAVIIDAAGYVAYHGAIDDGQGVDFVAQALTELIENRPVTTPRTEPSGTSLPASAPKRE